MKKSILGIMILLSVTTLAKEAVLCQTYYDDVSRKITNIETQGSNLSKIAKDKLYGDLKFDTTECISRCEGNKFSYCNEVAKKIESH